MLSKDKDYEISIRPWLYNKIILFYKDELWNGLLVKINNDSTICLFDDE